MTRPFPSNAIIGAAGENLVLSHLLRLNYVAGLAPYNTKDYDLIILNEEENIAKSIQVKSALYSEEIPNDFYWILKSNHEVPISNLIFCFVVMSMKSSSNKIYVIESEKVAYVTKISHQIYLKLPGIRGQSHNDSTMRRLSSDLKKSVTNKKNQDKIHEYLKPSELDFLEQHTNGWMDNYLDNWQILDN